MSIVKQRATYEAVTPHERNTIIDQINSGWLPRDNKGNVTPKSLETQGWWDMGNPSHPESKFPTRIYLLGKGTPNELFEKYQRKYPDDPMIRTSISGGVRDNVFANHIRELVRQGIFKISNP